MSDAPAPSVSVIITARNAAATIADAVTSALAQPETAQVIVVDDASSDATAAEAERAAGDDPRLTLIRCAVNLGPAAARNRAIEQAVGSVIAVLDADDFLLPGRFGRLLAVPDWDLVADNILFVAESDGPDHLPPIPRGPGSAPIDIDLRGFVQANRATRGGNRQEWGFLKPLMKKDFLDRHKLRYDPAMRLGEDYDLYVRLLLAGARFRVTPAVGYVARWRSDSLSSRHRTADLRALHDACRAHLRAPGRSAAERRAMRSLTAELRQRYLLREMLDHKRQVGRAGAVLGMLRRPSTLMPVLRGVLADKIRARRATPVDRVGKLLIG